MFTNADTTLYLYSKNGRTETYTRFPVLAVYWKDVAGAVLMKTGQKGTASVRLIIPRDSLDEPIAFTPGKDLAVKGIVTDEIDSTDQKTLSESLAALKASYEYKTVMTVSDNRFGSECMHHYDLVCK